MLRFFATLFTVVSSRAFDFLRAVPETGNAAFYLAYVGATIH